MCGWNRTGYNKVRHYATAVIVTTVCMTLGACGGVKTENGKMEDESMQEQTEMMEDTIELTTEEETLLCGMSVNEERVREGELVNWQKKWLGQYRYAMEYLQKKYPSHTFEATYGNPEEKGTSYATIGIFADGNNSMKDTSYKVYVEGNEEDGYSATDDYYGEVLEGMYEEYLMEKVAEFTDKCVGIRIDMMHAKGEEFDEKMTLEDFLSKNGEANPAVTFYLDGREMSESEFADIRMALENMEQENDLYGGWSVNAYNQVPETGKDAEEFYRQLFRQPDYDAEIYSDHFARFE